MQSISRSLLLMFLYPALIGFGVMVVSDAGISNAGAQQTAATPQQQRQERTVVTDNSRQENAAVAGEVRAAGTPAPFAFIELYTSEGCSSCPPADRNLQRIAEEAKAAGTNVYTLSYHVDYWNNLGWTDPYSSADFSNRQRQYARQFDSNRVYTPQMIVNGQVEFNGSNERLSNRAVELAHEITPNAEIRLNAETGQGKVVVRWQAENRNDDTLMMALVQNNGRQEVTRGENARRDLSHVNIVRVLKSVEQPGGSGQVEFDVPEGFTADGFHVIGFLQNRRTVTAAAEAQIATAVQRIGG